MRWKAEKPGTQVAKRKRQYRARLKRRERMVMLRWKAHRASRRAAIGGDGYFGMVGEELAYMQFRMTRALKKSIDEYAYFPGGGTERSQDNGSRELIVPVQLRTASPEGEG